MPVCTEDLDKAIAEVTTWCGGNKCGLEFNPVGKQIEIIILCF